MSYIVAVAARWTKSLKFTLSIAVHMDGWPKIIFDLWRRKKKELENNLTIFETCTLNLSRGQEMKENFSPTGSREERS